VLNQPKKKVGEPQTEKSAFPSGVKEKRRVQDQFRRWKKEKEKEKTGISVPKEKRKKERDPNAPQRERKPKNPNKITKNIKCGTCGQSGHMSTNKLCPLYPHDKDSKVKTDSQTPSTPTESSNDGSGLKIKITASVLQKANEKSKKKNLEFNNDYLTPRPQVKRRRKTKADECATILEKIIEKLNKHPSAQPFLKPVDIKSFPEYKRVIQKTNGSLYNS